MVKLLQAMAGAKHGGAEAFFTRLAIALERGGQEQRVVIRRDDDRAAALRSGGIEPLQLRFGGALDLLTRRRLAREVRRYRPDVVMTWMNRATAKMPPGRFVHVARLGGYYDLKYYRHCDHLIGNTPGIVAYLIAHGWPAERAHYIGNFVDTRKGTPVGRAGLNTAADAKVIVALGRLHRNKAFDVLIRSLAEVPDAVLWLAGDGPEEGALKALARDVGVIDRVRFLGWRDDTADLIAAADILACPSRHEPLGNVVIEAWAQAKPVVAAASDGPKHLITEGQNGLLCPIDAPQALALALRRVAETPALAALLGAGGEAAFHASFTEQKIVRQYQELFSSIVG
ncbi:MAG: glycosyltransferase [Proteobacteria bacterium]|nr:glycosyltransferase [Pseudomonadota bacterium]MDA1308668.1 glycosyltransferase [Pseudomonadota bacterium]